MFGPDFDNSAVCQNNFRGKNVIGGHAVNWDPRAGRIVRDHPADGGARTRGHVGAETKSMRLEKPVQLVEHDAGADAHAAIVDVEIVDLAIVPGEIDDQSFADRISDQASPGAARRDRDVFVSGSFDDGARFLAAGGKGNAERLDLVNRRVGRVKLTRQIIEMDVATGSADPFLGGGNGHWPLIYHKNARPTLAGRRNAVFLLRL